MCIMRYTYTGTLFSNKKEQNTLMYYNRDELQKCNTKGKSGSKDYISYTLTYKCVKLRPKPDDWLPKAGGGN